MTSGSPGFSFIVHSVCFVHTVLPLEIPDLHLSLSVSGPSHNEGERTQEPGDQALERMWNLYRICQALSLIHTVASGQNNHVLVLYGGASYHGAELTPSDQTTTSNFASLAAWKKYAADMLGSEQPLTLYLLIPLYEALYFLHEHLFTAGCFLGVFYGTL